MRALKLEGGAAEEAKAEILEQLEKSMPSKQEFPASEPLDHDLLLTK